MNYPYWDYTIKGKVTRLLQILIAQIMLYKLQIDITLNPDIFEDKQEFYRTERWVKVRKNELVGKGYFKCVGLHDNLLWWGIPQYVRINGGHEFDISVKDKAGRLIYCQDTATTLNDAMTSDATEQFFKGMGRAHTLMNMDIQKIIMIAVIAVGAVAGMYYLGVF